MSFNSQPLKERIKHSHRKRFGKYKPKYYTDTEKTYKYGVFHKSGYRPLMLVPTKEDGEKIIASKGVYAKLYEVRKLIW